MLKKLETIENNLQFRNYRSLSSDVNVAHIRQALRLQQP